jgi:ABC-type branched-subunit amino acid transport system ATPase component
MPDAAAAQFPLPAPHALEAAHLTRRFGGIVAVDDVSFTLGPGEMIGLIGPNGSGKTTLINLLTGALKPGGGAVRIDGSIMNGKRPHRFARHGIGRTFQVPRLFQRMTVRENLTVPAIAGSGAYPAREQIEGVLAFFGLTHLAEERARALTGGQRKLLELGRALMLNPGILCLDEPFAGVHPRLLDQVVDRIVRLNERGYTLIVVDHNLDAVRRIAEKRLMVMARGKLIADGAPSQALADPAVVAAYLGS